MNKRLVYKITHLPHFYHMAINFVGNLLLIDNLFDFLVTNLTTL